MVDSGLNCDIIVGQTLLDLAVLWKRETVLELLLQAVDNIDHHQLQNDQPGHKLRNVTRRRVILPCQVCPEAASDVRFLFSAGLRQAKDSSFPCYYFARELVTFSLPPGLQALDNPLQKQLIEDVVDAHVQSELEGEGVINWNSEIVVTLASRLYALNNRAAGDCLLDSVMQTVWGVTDRTNALRKAMALSLFEAESQFFSRWRNYETAFNDRLGLTLDESQWEAQWAQILQLAAAQGSSLEHVHIFVLAHILRRPIIVYAPAIVRSRVSGDKIGESSFQGVYLPLLWDRNFCHRSPIALAYTLGHFSALVAMQSDETPIELQGSGDRAIYLPLQDHEGKFFRIHFWRPGSSSNASSSRRVLCDWLDCWKTCRTGTLVAQQRLDAPPLPVRQMMIEWLARYEHEGMSSVVNVSNAIAGSSPVLSRQQPPPSPPPV